MFECMFRNVFQFLNENLFVYFKLRSRNGNDNSNSNSRNNRVNSFVKNNDKEITSNICLRSSFDVSNHAISIGSRSRSISSQSSSRLKINETSDRTQTVILMKTGENV